MWEIVGQLHNKRRAPRQAVHLPCRVSWRDAETPADRAWRTLIGHTRDVSVGGLSVVIPKTDIGAQDLTRAGRPLRITLALPTEQVDVDGAPVHWERVQEGETEAYLIGARLTDVSSRARARFVKYLHTLH